MRRLQAIGKRLLHPGVVPTSLLVIFCGAGFIYLFLHGLEASLLAYGAYALSAYTLAVLALQLPGAVKKATALVYENRHGSRYLTDPVFRVKISLYGSLGVNLAYAAFKLVAAILYASFWFGAVAIYYIVLAVMRFLMLRHMRAGSRDLRGEYKLYGLCGGLLFAMDLALTSVFYQMIHSGRGYTYPGTLIYAAAAYAFYCLTMAIVSLVRFRRLHSPALSAAKFISLSAALVSMFTLQTAMFASFGGDAQFQCIMNLATGCGVCAIVFGLSVYMVVRAGRNLKKIEINNSQT